MESQSEWLRVNLIENGNLLPTRLGVKRLITEISLRGSLAASAISIYQRPPAWCPDDADLSKVIFEVLHGFIEDSPATWFFLTDVDGGAALIARVESPVGDIRNSGKERLWDFELMHPEQGDGQYLVLLFSDNKAAIVFSRTHSLFDISFYGPEDIWTYISKAFYLWGQ